jgi:hypothetical protein
LNHAFRDYPSQRLCRLWIADRSQGVDRGRLFRHNAAGAKTGESPAQGLEDGDRGG